MGTEPGASRAEPVRGTQDHLTSVGGPCRTPRPQRMMCGGLAATGRGETAFDSELIRRKECGLWCGVGCHSMSAGVHSCCPYRKHNPPHSSKDQSSIGTDWIVRSLVSSLFRGQFELDFADSCDQRRPVAMLTKASKQRDRTMRRGDIDDAGHLPSESRSTRPSLQLLVQSANSDQ